MAFKTVQQRRDYMNRMYQLKRAGEWNPNPIYKKGKNINCSFCKKSFYKSPSAIRIKNYCSVSCMANGFVGNESTRKQTPIKIKCSFCKKNLLRPKWHVNQNTNNFCNHKCFGKWKSNEWTGKNNPAWSGGKYLYYGANWIKIQKYIRKRENHKCKNCNKKEKDLRRFLDIHHIVPFRFFSGNYKKANKESNLVALCENCHKKAENFCKNGKLKSWKEVRSKLVVF
jgi:hypothetical protein